MAIKLYNNASAPSVRVHPATGNNLSAEALPPLTRAATITLIKGYWRDQLALYHLTNEPIEKPGRIVQVPVAILIGTEAFAAEPTLHYIASLNKTGTAK